MKRFLVLNAFFAFVFMAVTAVLGQPILSYICAICGGVLIGACIRQELG